MRPTPLRSPRRPSAVAAVVLLFTTAAPALADDHWAAFRDRQRAEFAELPAVEPPAADPGENPIDAILRGCRGEHGLPSPDPADDHLLIRRIYLDAVGLLPPPAEVASFRDDDAPERVDRLVERLLADDRAYAEHWMTWWNDLLRNDEQTSIDGLREPITDWLYAALEENRPYDRMIHELLSPGEHGPGGYLKGILWRGRVNLSQRPSVQAAQNTAQVFLGTMIRCASCHDGFTTEWTLRDSYGLAAFFAEEPLEMARCEQATGLIVPPRFLYDGLGTVAPDAGLDARRLAVAEMVTRPKNPRFARIIVNRLWDRLLGRPIAWPIDEVYVEDAICPELLDWLAHDFMEHDYDLKHTIGLILASDAYAATADPEAIADASGLAPIPRRLTAEQFLDGVATVTGDRPELSANETMGSVLDPADEDARTPARAWRRRVPGPLAIALGRPNREQVVTEREQGPTMLMALEVTNGDDLAALLSRGASALLTSDWAALDPPAAVDALALRAYARPATEAEHALLDPLVGAPADPADARRPGVEDLLWMLLNSPEFLVLR